MTWFIFALLAAFFISIYYALSKYLVKRDNLYIIPGGIFLISALALLTISIINGVPQLGALFFPIAIADAILNIIAMFFYFRSLKIADITLVIPLLSFTPIFLIFTSFIILGELSTSWGIFGIFFIVLGSYILNLDKNGFLSPFRTLIHNRGAVYMIIFAFFISVTNTLDKLVILNSDTLLAPGMIQLFIAIGFITIAYKSGFNIIKSYRKTPQLFIIAGLSIAMAAFLTATAFTMEIVPYVMSIQRIGILFTVLYGFVFFKEKKIKQRLLGTITMLIGATTIILM